MTKDSQLRQRSKLCGDAMERYMDEHDEEDAPCQMEKRKHYTQRDNQSRHPENSAVDMKGGIRKIRMIFFMGDERK